MLLSLIHMKKPLKAEALLDKYLDGTASGEEKAIVETWQLQYPLQGRKALTRAQHRKDVAAVRASLPGNQQRIYRLPVRISIAAAAVLVLATTAILFFNRQQPKPAVAEAILPKTQGITLTLANGKTIAIAYGHHGSISRGIVQQDSVLKYTATETADEVHTLTNNSGRRFSTDLPDGTEVTLDIQSSVTFHTKIREVSMTGQDYFKVKHNSQQPFKVTAGNQTIEDIGTQFNVNAYESPKTTLVEGAVKVNGNLLKPGQQIENDQIHDADISEVTSWLQDKITYKNASLETVMNEVSRIYNVRIVWHDDLKKHPFFIILNRSEPLTNVLNYLRKTSTIDFKVEKQTITIYQKK